MAILYNSILNEMSHITNLSPPGYIGELKKLELKFSKEYDKTR